MLVATPRKRNDTAFWTTIVKTDRVGPMPTPVMNIHSHSIGNSVVAVSWVIRVSPKAIIARPNRMMILYRPVRDTRMPAMIELAISPNSSARVW